MNQSELKSIAARHVPNEHKFKKCCLAFLSGGLIGGIGQIGYEVLKESFSPSDSSVMIMLIVILIASISTGLGIYDKIAQHCGAGLFIPISGFSNALTSSAMECRGEGLVLGIGSNMFKLAGSVLTYGIISALIFSAIRYGIYLL